MFSNGSHEFERKNPCVFERKKKNLAEDRKLYDREEGENNFSPEELRTMKVERLKRNKELNEKLQVFLLLPNFTEFSFDLWECESSVPFFSKRERDAFPAAKRIL